MNKLYGKVLKDTQLFFFMSHAVWKGNTEDRVRLLGSNILNCCLKMTMADLRTIGLKMRE